MLAQREIFMPIPACCIKEKFCAKSALLYSKGSLYANDVGIKLPHVCDLPKWRLFMPSGVMVCSCCNLPVCVYLNYTWLIVILCFAGQLSMQWQCKQGVALKCIIQLKYVTEGFSLYSGRVRCLPPTLRSLTLRKTRTLFRWRVCKSLVVPQPCSGATYVVQYSWHWIVYTVSHAIHLQLYYMHACSGEGSALLCIH